jgi:hypothetical protein
MPTKYLGRMEEKLIKYGKIGEKLGKNLEKKSGIWKKIPKIVPCIKV